MSLPTRKLTATINGRQQGPIDVPEGMMMIDVLHELLNLTGSRLGCGIGICHACVVIWDRDDGTSEEVRTCITGADFFDGRRIRTEELEHFEARQLRHLDVEEDDVRRQLFRELHGFEAVRGLPDDLEVRDLAQVLDHELPGQSFIIDD